jgi:predicted nucleic acid-binding protein
MVRSKLYLDTSVLSAYFDTRTPERQELTNQFWAIRLPEFEPMVSTLVLAEIGDTPNLDQRADMETLVSGFAILELNEEAEELAESYVTQAIFSKQYLVDALHVAIASVHRIPYLASWNFRHLVRVQTRREVSLLNTLQGYESIEIVAPPEL